MRVASPFVKQKQQTAFRGGEFIILANTRDFLNVCKNTASGFEYSLRLYKTPVTVFIQPDTGYQITQP